MKKFYRIIPILFCAYLLFPSKLISQLRLPSILSSSMVLQQNDSVTLWGWCDPSAKVLVNTSWNNQTDSVTTDNGAQWKLKIKTPAAGGPYTITFISDDTLMLTDVMIGEVWVCSGQSNMEWSYVHGEKDVARELPAAANSNIRFFQVPKSTSSFPQDNIPAKWSVCDSQTLKTFSAVAYFFGKKLQTDLNVPVGLINTSWGGTPAEVWTPASSVEKDAALKAAADKLNEYAWWPKLPGKTFNAMIAPFTKFNIAGAIWYQGEANVGTNNTYRQLMTTMIDAWRNEWKKQFPFYYVQIAPFNYGDDNINGALLQESQTKTMSHPRVGMVVVSDLVDSVTNIHPSHKKEVGNRLANWALAENYRKQGVVYKSPSLKNAQIAGGKIVLTFEDARGGLKVKGKKAEGFFVAGDDKQWLPAQAKIDGDRVTVSNREVKEPKYVRYAFGNTAIGNVFSADGLPLIAFRTDE